MKGGCGGAKQARRDCEPCAKCPHNNALALNPSGGNVGVGTTTPYKALHVTGSSAGDVAALVANTNAGLASSASLGFGLWGTSGSGTGTSGPAAQISAVCMNAANGNTDVAFNTYTGSAVAPNYTLMERMRISAAGNVGIGTTTPDTGFATAIPNAKLSILTPGGGSNVKSRLSIGGGASHYAAIEGEHTSEGATLLSFMTCLNATTNSGNPETRMVIASSGNVGIGTAPDAARLQVITSATGEIFRATYNTARAAVIVGLADTTNGDWNGQGSVLYLSKVSGTSRSINASGTINASGADYAEYMTKDSDFPAQKGDILGVLPSGKLTNQFDAAIHFLLKSTNPCMVGGDVWGTEAIVGEKPKDLAESATEEEKAAHATALAAWEARLEAERQKVDRMAFAGQVPVNILGATPGNYIIPLRNTDGSIGIAAVSSADMSFSQYQSAVGRVISILADGRANVIVKAV